MTLIQLTEVTNSGDGPRPLMVNPDHVATLRPRKTIKPVDATQDLRTELTYDGTILTLATGAQHFVTEDFDTVHAALSGERKGQDAPIINGTSAPKKASPPPPKTKAEEPVDQL
jgi:hypothetical protein